MDKPKFPPRTRSNLLFFALAVLGVLLVQNWWIGTAGTASIPYSEFRDLVRQDQVAEVAVSANEIRGQLKQPRDGKHRFVTTRVADDLALELEKHGVKFTGQESDGVLPALLAWVVPAVVFFGLWMLLLGALARRGGQGPGFMAIGKSKAKVYVETDIKVTFDDVAGVDEAKAELVEVVSFLKNPQSYGRLGARMPKGVLLVGPPGTGKTLLARAVAGEAGVPFFSISGSEFVEMFVGVGAARVRDLFEQARRKAPCIIFIDELDALGRARHAHPGMGGHDEKEQTLNQLLVELDGFDATTGIVLIGATNRPEILDPALLRAGRFDRQVLVDRPDKRGRAQILTVHMRSVRLAPDVDADKVAALTPGFTGADLANLVNEAALAATRRGSDAVAMRDFDEAVERIIAGLEKRNRLLNALERAVVAHHEMGHALVAAALPGTDRVHKVSIIPRGIGALGYTIQRPTEDRYLMTRAELRNKMAVLLGGRAAELLAFPNVSTGAADDLAKVTDIGRAMVARYGMAEKLGPVAYDVDPPGYLADGAGWRPRPYSEETAREIDCAVRAEVDDALRRARDILQRNRALLGEGAARLIEQETLDEAQLTALFERVVVEPAGDPA